MSWSAEFRRASAALTRARERERERPHYLLFGTVQDVQEWRQQHPDIPETEFTHVWEVHHLQGRMGGPRMEFVFLCGFSSMRYADEITAIMSYYRPVDMRKMYDV